MAAGDAFTFVMRDEMKKLAGIERFIGQKIPQLTLEGFVTTSSQRRNRRRLGHGGVDLRPAPCRKR